jgi:hypothetical protein
MLKLLSCFTFLCCFTLVSAQPVRIDTVQRGYYLPFGSNYISCKVLISNSASNPNTEVNATGNRISDSLISVIGSLEYGAVVMYTDVTVLRNGALEKAPLVWYVIGKRNTQPALRDPSLGDTLTAKEIGAIVLDVHVSGFSVSWTLKGNTKKYDVTGNRMSAEARKAIEALPSGTKVRIDNIRRKEENGSLRTMPAEIHIVR